MTNVVIRGGLAWRQEGEALVTLTPGEAADEIERLQSALDEALCVLDAESPVTAARLRKSLGLPVEPSEKS